MKKLKLYYDTVRDRLNYLDNEGRLMVLCDDGSAFESIMTLFLGLSPQHNPNRYEYLGEL